MATDSEQESLADWDGGISTDERIHHELLFFSQGPVNGYLTGEHARDLFLHSRLPLPVLSKIWNLADVSNDNLLNVHEFVLAMHLIIKVMGGVSVPKSLPKHLVPKATAPLNLPEMDTAEKAAYLSVFKVFDTERTGLVNAIQGRQLFLESGQGGEELSTIWDVSDIDKDGQLSADELSIACHLIRFIKQGGKLGGPVDVFSYLPHKLPPNSYHARKHRVDSYDEQKHQLMTLKEKRKAQITNESRRLELLKRRFALHKELYDQIKQSGTSLIPEEEFQLYEDKEKQNIEKVEEIVYRLKKEHEKVRQETVRVILGEQGSLQVDARLVKLEQTDIHTRLTTSHTKATKDPDPFHQLYEKRKEDRKKSTLSEGEEPEIYHPFLVSPFDPGSLISPVTGQQLFLNPYPSVYNNNTKNSHQGRELLDKLHQFGDGFLEEWAPGVSRVPDQETDALFISLHVPMETKVWSGLQWADDRQSKGDKLEELHIQLVSLKADFQKLNEDSGGQLLFRNPEDYLARRKAQDEEDRLEKSKQRRYNSEKRSTDDKTSKRKSYHTASAADEESHKSAREKYRYNRRSLNLDKESEEAVKSGEISKRSERQPKTVSAKSSDKSQLKVTEEVTPQNSSTRPAKPAPSPVKTSSSTKAEGEGQTFPRDNHISPPLSPRKKKVAPPPPNTPPLTSPAVSPRDQDKPDQSSSAAAIATVAVATPESVVDSTIQSTVSGPVKQKPQESPKKPSSSRIPQARVKIEQPSRPPRRKRKDSKENQSFLHKSFELEQEHSEPQNIAKVDVSVETPKQSTKVKPKVERVPSFLDKVRDSIEVVVPVLPEEITQTNTDTPPAKDQEDVLPQSNIDDIIVEPTVTKVTTTTEQSVPHTNGPKFVEKTQTNADTSDTVEVDFIIPSVKVASAINFEKVSKYLGESTVPDGQVSVEVNPVLIEESHALDDPVEESVEIVTVTKSHSQPPQHIPVEQDNVDEPDAYLDHIKPMSFKKAEDIDLKQAFQKIELLPEIEKSKELSDTSSDTGSEAPPLPETLPPPLPSTEEPLIGKSSSLTEITEVLEAMETVPVQSVPSGTVTMEAGTVETPSKEVASVEAPAVSIVTAGKIDLEAEEIPDIESPASPRSMTSPIADLKASMFSMRVTSPTREVTNTGYGGELKINTKFDNSDLSEGEGSETTGNFSPGRGETRDVPVDTNIDDDGGIQLISYSNTLNSPNSDNSQPDSAFEDMQSSMTSNDPLSNTLDDIPQEELIVYRTEDRQESAPTSNSPVKKFELSLDDWNSTPGKHGLSSSQPQGGSDFMQRAQQFANAVQKPPKMTVTRKREITSPDDLTDERYIELEAERRAVISSSTMKKRNIDRPTVQMSMDDSPSTEDTSNKIPKSPEPSESVREWRSDLSTRGNITWENKPDKVNLYSENVIQESENTESINRESITDLNSIRKQWETIHTSQNQEGSRSPVKSSVKPVRHWEVKLPTLKKVPAKPVERKDDSDSDGEGNSNKMDDTVNANESAIEREIRLAMEREEMLKQEKEERAALTAKQNQSPQKSPTTNGFSGSEQNNNNKATYHEMTEADRGEELNQRQLEEDLEQTTLNKEDTQEEVSEESATEDEKANESIIEREIRIQREREEELKRNRNTGKQSESPSSSEEEEQEEEEEVEHVVVEEVEVVTVEVTETLPSPTPSPLSAPETQSDVEAPYLTRNRISYEEAISKTNHSGESLIARELREAREREEELNAQRQRLSSSHPAPVVKQQSPVVKQTTAPEQTYKPEGPKAGTYQKDVSPFKQSVRRHSQDSLSSSSNGKTPDVVVMPPKVGKAPTFESRVNQMANITPEAKEKHAKKQESTIDREIRLARERENEFRTQRGLPVLADVKKEESSDSEEESNVVYTPRASNYNRSTNKGASIQKFASTRLQQEIKKQSELESTYRAEGKIVTTSEDHVGLVNFTELASPSESAAKPKRNFTIPKKEVAGTSREAAQPHQNGTTDTSSSPVAPQTNSDALKFRRSTSSGGVHFSYKESRHKAESKIELELREMREREDELRAQRSGAGQASPREPDSPRSPSAGQVVNKRSQFEQTT